MAKPQSINEREAAQAQAKLAAERAEQTYDPTALAPDEVGRTVELTPAAIAAEERSKQELLAGMRLPKPAPGQEAKDRTDEWNQRAEPASRSQERRAAVQPPEPAPSAVPDEAVRLSAELVTTALADQALCLAVVEDAKAMLEAANLRVVQARQEAAGVAYQQAVIAAQSKMQPLADKVTRLRDALQGLHNRHGETLRGYARSNASGDLVTRTALQAIYNAASPLQQKIAVAFKSCDEARRALAAVPDAGPDSLSWSIERAEEASATALQVSASAIRAEVEGLIARFTALRGTPTVTVRLLPQRDEDRNPGSDTRWDHDVRK